MTGGMRDDRGGVLLIARQKLSHNCSKNFSTNLLTFLGNYAIICMKYKFFGMEGCYGIYILLLLYL